MNEPAIAHLFEPQDTVIGRHEAAWLWSFTGPSEPFWQIERMPHAGSVAETNYATEEEARRAWAVLVATFVLES